MDNLKSYGNLEKRYTL